MKSRFRIRITDDEMEAHLCVDAGEPCVGNHIRTALEKAGVCHGVLEESLECLEEQVSEGSFTAEEQPIAHGTPPVPGNDGYFAAEFSADKQPGKVRADGSMDFRDRNALVVVNPDDLLGLYHGPTGGTPGSTVRGSELEPTLGKDVPLELGGGTELRDGRRVVATCDGVINYKRGGVLQVNEAYEHGGDVDLKSGDLKMNGAIVVARNVARNAKVRSSDCVIVKGAIDLGAVEADGAVTVVGGVVGNGNVSIRSGGDVLCLHAQGAQIECKGTLTIRRNSVGSTLKARVITGESKAMRIFGGTAHAEEAIVVGEAGSELGARTVLSVGRSSKWEHESVAVTLGGVDLKGKAGAKKGDKKSKVGAKRRRPEKDESAADALKRLLAIARIEVTGTIHPGVVIEIGELSLNIEREMRGVSFRYTVTDDQPEIEAAQIVALVHK